MTDKTSVAPPAGSHTLTAADAKAHFAESLRLVERGEVVIITRYGTPVAAMVGPADLEQLRRLRARSVDQGLASLIGRWDDGRELVEALDANVRDDPDERPIPELD